MIYAFPTEHILCKRDIKVQYRISDEKNYHILSPSKHWIGHNIPSYHISCYILSTLKSLS